MKHISLEAIPVKTRVQGVNHYLCVDVSGSMYNTLPKIRSHLKNRMSLLVKPQDTVTLIYFSGKGQSGVIFEGQPIKTITDLTAIHSAIDRHLTPIGMTAFIDPLDQAIASCHRVSQLNNNSNSLSFMTDGYDNSYTSAAILDKARVLPQVFTQTTILEYGWNCNRELLSKIAQLSGAVHVFSEDYQVLQPAVETVFTQEARVLREIHVSGESVIYFAESAFVVVPVNNGVAAIPDDVTDVYIVETSMDVSEVSDTSALLATAYYALANMKSGLAWDAFTALSDPSLYQDYSNCFTKQDYSNLMNRIRHIYQYPDLLQKGKLTSGSTTTVLDILQLLASGDNYLVSDHPDFKYNRIGKQTEQKEDQVIANLTEQMQVVTDVKDIKTIASQIVSHEEFVPEFTPSADSGKKSLNALVFNETRPNVSIQTSESGSVSIPESKQKEFNLPPVFETWITRNFTIVKDGIINTKKLPVVIDQETYDQLAAKGIAIWEYEDIREYYDAGKVYILPLTDFPLMSRADVVDRDLSEFVSDHVKLQDLKARQKVIKALRDERLDRRASAGYSAFYGEDAAKWLYDIGLRDYGFTPPVKTVKSGDDSYMSKELSVKIKGLSSLPSIKAVRDKVAANKKLNLADHLIYKWLVKYEDILNTLTDDVKDTVLTKESKAVIADVRTLQKKLNQVMYSILIGKSWFIGCTDIDSTAKDVMHDGYQTTVNVVVETKEIKI